MDTALFGREPDLFEVEKMLQSARHGLAALVLEGDPGIGKTSVWRAGIASAAGRGSRVLSCRATQAEARLSFAALGDLLAPVEPAAFDALPDPQRRALDAALLRAESGGAAPNPRAIGTGLVTLLQALAASAPLLVAIDDVQWLDGPSAHALEFALRRLEAHPVALLATRRLGVRGAADGLLAGERMRVRRVGPLSLGALYRIVEARLGRRLPRPLLVRIERASGGNPFFALEIARALGARDDLAAGEALPIPDDLSELVAGRLQKLPRRTREALLRVTALAQPTLAVVAAADLEPAEEAGIVAVRPDGRIELTHPLFASAVHAAAPHERRRKLHAELAEVATDVEERARHLMLALVGEPDEPRVAAILDQAAEHALRRGAPGIAAEFSERSARLTRTDDDAMRRRQLRAAQHYLKAGDPEHARALCDGVLAASPPDAARAEALHCLAEAALTDRPATAIPLLEAALGCVHDDVLRAAQLESALGAVLTLVLDLPSAYRHLARAVELAVQAGDTALAAEAIAMREASGLLCGQGIDEAELSRALAWEDPEREAPFQMRASLNVACAYEYLARFDVAQAQLEELHARVVARGDEADLPWVLGHLAAATGMGGDTERGEEVASEAERAAALTGSELFRAFALVVRANLRAIRGSDGARADAEEALAISTRIGWPIGMANPRWALSMLALAEGDPTAAWAALAPVVAAVESFGIYEWPVAMALPDAIEALVATGDAARAKRLAEALHAWGRRFDRPWALATSGRCRALLAAAAGDLEGGVVAAEEGLVAHERLPFPFEHARTLLVLGQLQRRRGERREARATLERALAIFERIGARLWLEKTKSEIARIGVRRAPAELTESEQRVAELAAAGLKNPEIAARLFMSRRTVEANLARAYRKLEIRSRAELGAVMAGRKASSHS